MLVLTLTGCEKPQQGWHEERMANWMYTVEYHGHSYIVLNYNSSANGIVHDPDCPCQKKGGQK